MYYRRAKFKGGSYFLTLNLLNREQDLLTHHIDLLRQSIREVKRNHPFYIDAVAILPDHIHILMTLPTNDCDYSKRDMLLKSSFSRQLPKTETISPSRSLKAERGIWQRRFWEHLIRDEKDYINHIDYIHYNPVKHGYVTRPVDWPYSSIHRYIKDKILTPDWGSQEPTIEGQFGE